MYPFHVKITAPRPGWFRVEYFYITDLRYDKEYENELPVLEIYRWLTDSR